MFTDKVLLITGGTGSFGNAVLDRFLDSDIGEIRIFSRDEKKQDDMRHQYHSPKIKYYIGDVRSPLTLKHAFYGVDYIFHSAALKQVPSCEFFPMEAVRTNIIGTDNVLNAAVDAGVKKVICLSTDKAAYPINAMGTSKAMMEKVMVAKARMLAEDRIQICGTRYGNVACSRGSVIPLFVEQIKAGEPLTVTEPEMTRFIMTLEEAVELVVFAFQYGQTGDILVQKAPACTVKSLALALCDLFSYKEGIKIIGMRHGEKMYETLLTREESRFAKDMGNYYCIPPDNRDLNYDSYLTKGMKKKRVKEFNSDNANQLGIKEMKEKLLTIPYIQKELSNYKEV